jgi:hypothetical protein
MTIEEMNIPEIIKKEAADMIRRIEQAATPLELSIAGAAAEGFMIGINCLKAMVPKDVDTLEVIFSVAIDLRAVELGR